MLMLVDDSESEAVEIMQLLPGEMRIINGFSLPFDRTDHTGISAAADVLLLTDPLYIGASWTREARAARVDTATVLSFGTEITTPAGTFEAMVVQVESTAGITIREYWVPGTGRVRLEREQGSVSQYLQLIDVIYAPFNETVVVFLGWDFEIEYLGDGFPNITPVPELDYFNIEFHTNDCQIDVLNAAFRKYITWAFDFELDPALLITDIDFDRNAELLTVSFSALVFELFDDLGEGRYAAAQLAADTLGFMFGSAYVRFVVDGVDLFDEDTVLTHTLFTDWWTLLYGDDFWDSWLDDDEWGWYDWENWDD